MKVLRCLLRQPGTFAIALALLALGVASFPAAIRAESRVSVIQLARDWRQQHEVAIVEEFSALLAQPNYAGDHSAIRATAGYILGLLNEHGIQGELLSLPDDPSAAVPAIFAEIKSPGAQRTLCLYVHYDGQPVMPENWQDPPYQPVMRNARLNQGGARVDWRKAAVMDPEWRLYARSAGDDKAPIVALLAALDALRANDRPLGVNLKLFFEGEEEIGSPNLRALVEAHQERLAADFWLFLDGPLHQSGVPTLALGVRGVMGADLTVFGPERGLHSGHYGNYAVNPLARLTHLLTSMRDEQGQILIEGFAQAATLSPAEQALLARSPSQDVQLLADLGLAEAERPGERYELSLLRPALNFKGLRAGDVGSQARNVVLPEATASLGFRLIAGQSVAEVRAQVEAHLRSQAYHLIDAEQPSAEERARYPRLARLSWESAGYPAVRTALDHPAAQALIGLLEDYRQQAGAEALLGHPLPQVVVSPSLGGSLPLAHVTDVLNVPFALLPIANHDDNQHAPNEHLRLGNLWYGIELYAAVLAELDW